MMDMEIGAELERDGGSETGEASTEGSSAGSVYCTLEQDFAKITSEMKSNEALAVYEAEYTRLFESLYKAQRLEEELTEKCRVLKEEVEQGTSKTLELERRIDSDEASMEKLRKDILESKRLADSAHTREQKAQEVIENLRVSVAKLTEEISQKNKQLASEDTAATSKQQKDGSKERERLINEMDALKQRLKKLSKTNADMLIRLADAEGKTNELQENNDKLTNELARERREKERYEAELESTHQDLQLRSAELQASEERLKISSSSVAALEGQLREQTQENEKNQKEIQKLMLKQMSMKLEADRLQAKSEEVRKEAYEKGRTIKDMAREIERMKDELAKTRADKENALKKLTKERDLATKAEDQLQRNTASLRSAELEITALRRQLIAEKKTNDKLTREKDSAQKNAAQLEDSNRKLTLEIRVFEQTKRKMELSIDDMTEAANEMQRQIKTLEKERDRCILESQELANKVEDYMDEMKMKRVEITEYQRRLQEAEAKFRQQQSLFEEVRGERNTFKKGLHMTTEELTELKEKFKNLSQQLDQMRDQLSQKEAALVKQEFLFGKTEKEKEALRAELAQSRATIGDLHVQMHEQKQEEKKLRASLQEADSTINRQNKEIEAVMSERDIIGSQLVRRNDEMALQSNQLQILQQNLSRGEKQYAQRLSDARMLKLEIKSLRRDNEALKKQTSDLAELRGQLFHLERDLTGERLKVTALEEDMQNPLNVHRWRSLEATDPSSFELLRKIHLLQKRVLRLSAQLIDKDKQIHETEKLYVNLREIVSKQPGPEVLVCLNKTRRALRDRSKKMKCLVAELNMTTQSEHKFEISKYKREANTYKAKYLAQKRKQYKSKSAAASVKENLPTMHEIEAGSSKFYGGGFNLNPPSGKSSTNPLVTINK